MDIHSFYQVLKEAFGYSPTLIQDIAIQQLSRFLTDKKNNRNIFLLKGYAGTGKTTLINALVKSLDKIQMKSALLAPTGRASKVITEYTRKPAFTIHKYIYQPKSKSGYGVSFLLKANKAKNTLFIVDEASMISDTSFDNAVMKGGSLLDDLMQFVYSGTNCKLLLIGDTAQLPPVHSDISPALDAQNLQLQYDKDIIEIELNEVVRQAQDSGILHNATKIREQLESYFTEEFTFDNQHFKDIIRLTNGMDIQEAIQDNYAIRGIDETSIIVRSNKRAVLYNKQIRQAILGYDEELVPGDLLMVVRNNYFWIKSSSPAGFIANGDTVEILQIYNYKELYGFRFAEVKVQMIDYPNQPAFDTVLLLDTLESGTTSLSYEEQNQLYQEVMLDYQEERTNYKKYLKVKNNPYFNALQVKYSYAITCHKSQGGQWDTIFIEKPYLPEGINIDYLRWLYTAITRAKKKIYLINFKDEDFEYKESW